MAISVSLLVTPAAPASGVTVTATYVVTGNDGAPSQVASVVGKATIGAVIYDVTAQFTLPGGGRLPESFDVPTCPGLTFAATADPHVFTARVP